MEISGVTDALPFTMNALLYLRITALEISTTAADGAPVHNLNRIVGLQHASLGQAVTNASLGHFSKLTSWPKSISFRGNPAITNQGLEAIEASKLRQSAVLAFDFRETGVTEVGVKKLAERFSHSTIQWDGGIVGPLALERQRAAAQTARDRGASVMLFGNKYVTTSADIVAPDSFRTLVFATGTHTNHLTPSAKGYWESALTGTITKPFTAEELAAVLPNMPCQEIWLCGQTITDEGGAKLLSQLAPEGIVVLKITNCEVADQTAKAVASLPVLTFLSFDDTKLTDAGVKHLVGRLPKLSVLRLANTQLTNDAIPDLGQFAALHNLDLKGTQITEDGANKLAKLLPRTWIRYGTGTVIEPKSNVGAERKAAEWVLSVGGAVKVNNSPPTAKELTAITELPKEPYRLTNVRIRGNDTLKDEAFAVFQDCTELTALGFDNVSIGDEGLTHFRNAKKLTHLYLPGGKITNAGLAVFQDCDKLLALGLGQTLINDDSIPVLSGFKLLQQLDVTGTQITEDGIAKLQAALPNCTIFSGEGKRTKPVAGLKFDGKSTFVSIPALQFDGNLPITLEAWITPETVSDGQERHICLLGEPGGGIGISKDGAFGVGFFDGNKWHSDYTRIKLKAGETVHVAAVVTKERLTLFIDGKQAGIKEVNLDSLPKTQAPSLLGKPTKNASGAFFHGTIHSLRISKSARYTKDFTPQTSLVADADTTANYQFRDVGKRLTDTTKSALHGDIENGTWSEKK